MNPQPYPSKAVAQAAFNGSAVNELWRLVARGIQYVPKGIVLSSGHQSQWFIDIKKALSNGTDLKVAAQAITEMLNLFGVEYTAIGGLTMGADPLAYSVAMYQDDVEWFVVRKHPKGRGTNSLIEGSNLTPQSRVVLIDDVATTGNSLRFAYDAVVATGAEVIGAVAIVDRGTKASRLLGDLGIPYYPVFKYLDFDIPSIEQENQ
jgi:orotate phosphoribosyltransferase